MVPPSPACLLEALINAAETVGAITMTPPELIHPVMRTMRQEHVYRMFVAKAGASKLLGSVEYPPPPHDASQSLSWREDVVPMAVPTWEFVVW